MERFVQTLTAALPDTSKMTSWLVPVVSAGPIAILPGELSTPESGDKSMVSKLSDSTPAGSVGGGGISAELPRCLNGDGRLSQGCVLERSRPAGGGKGLGSGFGTGKGVIRAKAVAVRIAAWSC